MSPIELFLLFLKATMLTSGGLAPLALLQDDFVTQRDMLTSAHFAAAVAVGRITPGPNGLFVISIGYYVAGLLGALLGGLALCVPGFMGIGLVHAHRRLANRPWVVGMTRGLTISGVGLLSATGYGFALPLAAEPASFGIFMVALGVLLATTTDALPVLGAGALLGIALRFLGVPLA